MQQKGYLVALCSGFVIVQVPQTVSCGKVNCLGVRRYGYLLVEASNTKLSATMFAIDPTTQKKSLFDRIAVDLTHDTVS